MGNDNNNPQKVTAPRVSAMPNKVTAPSGDDQTQQMIKNYKAMQDSGIFQTPYQKNMQDHPIRMGIANAMQAFGQGITKQPFYTSNQDNQASLQNTNLQGINAINTLPAQMRMMMMMQGINGTQPTTSPKVPGVPASLPNVIPTPSGGNQVNPQLAAARAAGYSDQEIQAYLAGKK